MDQGAVSRKSQLQSSTTEVSADEETQSLVKQTLSDIDEKGNDSAPPQQDTSISKTGLKVLALLAVQNCSKNILMRFVMIEKPDFLLSTAVIVVELLKLAFSALYIQFSLKQPAIPTIIEFIKNDWNNTLLLFVPAASYSIQMSLEYVAFANIDASTFSVLVQTKMLATAFFFRLVMKRQLLKRQLMSLTLLTVGVMLCNMKVSSGDEVEGDGNNMTGIAATLGIANFSAFASVYTEKVIKSKRKQQAGDQKKNTQYGLAHMQAQLAIVSLVILGCYAVTKDFKVIMEKGFFHNFNGPALLSCLNSSIGGLIVAAVLKHANSVLKGYATAVSVVLTGVLSNLLFGTPLTLLYGMGIINVVLAVLLYNATGLEDHCL